MEDSKLIKNMVDSNDKIVERLREVLLQNEELREELQWQKEQEKARSQKANHIFNQKVAESKEETEMWRRRFLNLEKERNEKIFEMTDNRK
jgi:hypothetical protein